MPSTPPQRVHTTLRASTTGRNRRIATDHPKTTQTPGPPIKAPTPLLEGPIKTPGRGVQRPTVQSRGCRKQSVCRRQSRAKTPPEAPGAAHSTPSDGRRRAHGGPEPAPSKHDARASTQDSSPADAVAPQVVRQPDHGRQFERRLRVQFVERRRPETRNLTKTAAAAAVEINILARLVPLDHQRRRVVAVLAETKCVTELLQELPAVAVADP